MVRIRIRVLVKQGFVKNALARKNRDLQWLADKIGITPSSLSNLIYGNKSPSPETRNKMVAALQPCKWDDIFDTLSQTEGAESMTSEIL